MKFRDFLVEKGLVEKAGDNLSPAVEKIIKTWVLKPREKDPRIFYEAETGSYNDDRMLKKIMSDFEIIAKGSYAWSGVSKKELVQVDYTEGSFYLIVYKNMNELNDAIKKTKEFAKDNW